MAWYMKPERTCRVLNRIADRIADLDTFKVELDRLTELLWAKQEAWDKNHASMYSGQGKEAR